MAGIKWTRRNKLFVGGGGLLLVLVAAALVMGLVTGIPGSGRKLLGSARSGYPYNFYEMYLESGWIGASTGVVSVTNTYRRVIVLKGYHWHADSVRNPDYPNRYWYAGELSIGPGQSTAFDYKGLAVIELYEKLGPGQRGDSYFYGLSTLSWNEVRYSENAFNGRGDNWGPLNLHW